MGGGNGQGSWGNLGSLPQKYITTYTLSPYEQRVCAGTLKNAVFNTARRTAAQLPYVGTAFAGLYFLHSYAVKANEYEHSKAGMKEFGHDH